MKNYTLFEDEEIRDTDWHTSTVKIEVADFYQIAIWAKTTLDQAVTIQVLGFWNEDTLVADATAIEPTLELSAGNVETQTDWGALTDPFDSVTVKVKCAVQPTAGAITVYGRSAAMNINKRMSILE